MYLREEPFKKKKILWTTKNHLGDFYDIKKNWPEPHETQEKLMTENVKICSVLVNTDQVKKVMKNVC